MQTKDRPKIDNALVKISGEQLFANIDLLGIHLRDARNVLASGIEDATLAKVAILLASAALEAHLSYWRSLALAWAEAGAGEPLALTDIQHLKARERYVDEQGNVRERIIRTPLQTKLLHIPSILARVVKRDYELNRKVPSYVKLMRMLTRRDAILHPRWDRYLGKVGMKEAAEAVDAVELYLSHVVEQLHPYLAGYFSLLYTVPPGRHKNDGVFVGYRTEGKRPLQLVFTTVPMIGISEVLVGEWFHAQMLVKFALESNTESDSDGSMLTRGALVMLFAMLNIQLSIIAQIEIARGGIFEEAELLYLNEYLLSITTEGKYEVGEDRQTFKNRIRAIPRILARGSGLDITVDLGDTLGASLLASNHIRERIMHSPIGEPIPRVSKQN